MDLGSINYIDTLLHSILCKKKFDHSNYTHLFIFYSLLIIISYNLQSKGEIIVLGNLYHSTPAIYILL